jgi:hypothetical protein
MVPTQSLSVKHPPHCVPAHVVGAQSCVCNGGHCAELPVQLAASVATDAVQLAVRHSTSEGLNSSMGHALLKPSQVSSRSQLPAAARQALPAAFFISTHMVEEPLQVSATSHGPAAARQVRPGHPAGC